MGTEREFTRGDEHTMQCADDVLLSCILKTWGLCELISLQ